MTSPALLRFRLLASIALVLVSTFFAMAPAVAAENPAVEEMAGYLDFVDYQGGVMLVQQIPDEEWKNFVLIDTRDAGQYGKGHIPGAINIEWRRVLAEREKIPTDKPVLVYCNTGSLSGQAGFALRVAGYENVRILQGGYNAWLKARGEAPVVEQ
ncbi:rhodanese-like domain-containing protein [Hydrogenophaga sp. 5NK40-0174]|uniref:rhodanese-like domain-containing protein n=1 Tax=Hydrogenophaga sp. 5NK40-0174 TaxID=3127649 RepID=UPI0031070EDD